MAQSLGLTAYRALTRRSPPVEQSFDQPRPDGELVWFHAGERDNILPLEDLALRLRTLRPNAGLLVTYPEEGALPPLPDRGRGILLQQSLPSEHPQAVRAFLAHWKPDLCLWAWGGLRPNLVLEAAEAGCTMVLVDADSSGFDGRRDRWLPDLTRRLLSKFDLAFARSAAGRKRLMQLGLSGDRIEITAPLLAGGQPLDCADSDLEELTSSLAGRAVWFATRVLPREVPIVLSAHEKALRLSHRLLLVINPAVPSQAADIAAGAAERNMPHASWSDGQFPEDSTQILIAEDPADRGLFFRLAPVSFLGSSLIAGEKGCDPFDAATLGSAVLYGPKIGNHLGSYSRLAAAGAARIVNDESALGTAVTRLIAPDQAATMAHAGWDVISQGAEVADRVLESLQDRLDQRIGKP